MTSIKPQYITDKSGKRISVVLPIKDYEVLMEELEELNDIKLYDEVKKSKESSVPIEEAFRIIEAQRNG